MVWPAQRGSGVATGRRRTTLLLMMGIGLLALMMPLPGHAEFSGLRLYMIHLPGCPYCDRWEAEVGSIYDKTAEARIAPLERIEITDARKTFAQFAPLVYTPTFVLARDGKEIARITGYHDEAFFWGQLDAILRNYASR